MNPLHLRWLIPIALAMPAAAATLQDAPPPDLAAIRDFLAKLQAQQEAAVKQRRATAFDTVKIAATNGENPISATRSYVIVICGWDVATVRRASCRITLSTAPSCS